MGYGWDEVEKAASKNVGNGNVSYLRLKDDGESASVVFLGQPYTREVVWTGMGYERYDAQVHTSEKPKSRVSLIVGDVDSERVLIWEAPIIVAKDLVKLRKTHDFAAWSFEITRHGGRGDSKTTYAVTPRLQLESRDRGRWARCQLPDLEAIYTEQDGVAEPPPAKESGGSFSDDDIPF